MSIKKNINILNNTFLVEVQKKDYLEYHSNLRSGKISVIDTNLNGEWGKLAVYVEDNTIYVWPASWKSFEGRKDGYCVIVESLDKKIYAVVLLELMIDIYKNHMLIQPINND